MAGPLMPQWVMSRGPEARSFVPGIKTVASSTTVPIRAVRASSFMLNVKSEGTGVESFPPKLGGTQRGLNEPWFRPPLTPFPTDGRLPVAFPNSGGEQKRATESPLPLEGDRGRLEVKWRGYDIQGIIDQRYAAKLPCAEDSNRHKESLKLATDLLIMLDGDKA